MNFIITNDEGKFCLYYFIMLDRFHLHNCERSKLTEFKIVILTLLLDNKASSAHATLTNLTSDHDSMVQFEMTNALHHYQAYAWCCAW